MDNNCCDNCRYYKWYWDKCIKYNCIVDARGKCSDFVMSCDDKSIPIDDICKAFNIDEIGDFSDGYHTFNQLYHQRAILFAVIVNQNSDVAWKSFKHEDGKYCFDSNGEWFIVGIDTPEGSFTYHYETSKYWDVFQCKEIPVGKHWDGHTEEDVTRLFSLV